MLSETRRRLGTAVLFYAASMIAGVVGATAIYEAQPASSAYAAPHCTRYSPPTVPDTLCSTNGTIVGYECTDATANRDENFVIMAAARSWNLAYDDGACSDDGWTDGGFGTYGQMTFIIGQYRAECKVSSTVSGNCTTNWHD